MKHLLASLGKDWLKDLESVCATKTIFTRFSGMPIFSTYTILYACMLKAAVRVFPVIFLRLQRSHSLVQTLSCPQWGCLCWTQEVLQRKQDWVQHPLLQGLWFLWTPEFPRRRRQPPHLRSILITFPLIPFCPSVEFQRGIVLFVIWSLEEKQTGQRAKNVL